MTTPAPLDGIALPKAYVLRPNPTQPTWALQVTTGNSDPLRITIPVGVSRISVSWNGPGSIRVYVNGLETGIIPADATAKRRSLPIFEVANDDPKLRMQLIGSGLTSADVGRYTAGVTVYPILTIS